MILGILGIYMGAAAIFYSRLTAAATSGSVPKLARPSHWHRARHLTKAFVRRVRPAQPKH